MRLPQYTKGDLWIMLGVLVPSVLLMNWALFGEIYFSSVSVFCWTTLVTFIVLAASWQAHTWVAVTLRKRFPAERDYVLRIAMALILFYLMTSITLTILFWGYEQFHVLDFHLSAQTYKWVIIAGVVANTFITFLHEGVARFEKLKTTLVETEQLKKEYMHSQLLGLKSQVNPHFLFNSLNSLSSLINENQQKAETFLDEMSKVYRYLLRNSDDELVTLDTELKFVRSYFHLLEARHGNGVRLQVDIHPSDNEKLLPPLTLQILLECAFHLNRISKDNPLQVEIRSEGNGWLEVRNNVQRRIGELEDLQNNSGVENISKKCKLLCHQPLVIKDSGAYKIIKVPLMAEPQTITA